MGRPRDVSLGRIQSFATSTIASSWSLPRRRDAQAQGLRRRPRRSAGRARPGLRNDRHGQEASILVPCGPSTTVIPRRQNPLAIAAAFWDIAPHATPTAPTRVDIIRNLGIVSAQVAPCKDICNLDGRPGDMDD